MANLTVPIFVFSDRITQSLSDPEKLFLMIATLLIGIAGGYLVWRKYK